MKFLKNKKIEFNPGDKVFIKGTKDYHQGQIGIVSMRLDKQNFLVRFNNRVFVKNQGLLIPHDKRKPKLRRIPQVRKFGATGNLIKQVSDAYNKMRRKDKSFDRFCPQFVPHDRTRLKKTIADRNKEILDSALKTHPNFGGLV